MPAVRITGVNKDSLSSVSSRLRELEVAELKARLLVELGMDKEAKKYAARALALDPADPASRLTSVQVLVHREIQYRILPITTQLQGAAGLQVRTPSGNLHGRCTPVWASRRLTA